MSLLLLLRPSKKTEDGGHFYPGDPNPFILKDIPSQPDTQPDPQPEEVVEEFLAYQELPSVESHLSEYDKETQELILRKARKRASLEQQHLDDLTDEIAILEKFILLTIQEFEEEAVIMLLLSDL